MTTRAMLVVLGQGLLAVTAGIATACQPAINAKFAAVNGHRLHGGVVNFCVGVTGLVLIALALRVPKPTAATLSATPWWAWTGGMMGAYFVVMALTLVPVMGAASYLTAMVLGQLLASAVIDHYGHLGLMAQPISPAKMAGLGLVLAGVIVYRL